jgi:hypothetical protein
MMNLAFVKLGIAVEVGRRCFGRHLQEMLVDGGAREITELAHSWRETGVGWDKNCETRTTSALTNATP